MCLAAKIPALVALTLGVARAHAQPQPATDAAPPATAFIDGRWFDGTRFVPRTPYAVDGRFAERRPARVDTTIDLAGRWVVPPFGEAHNHNLGFRTEADERAVLRRYVDAGVLYVAI